MLFTPKEYFTPPLERPIQLSTFLNYHDNGQGITEKQFRFPSPYINEFALAYCTSMNLKILSFRTRRKSHCYFFPYSYTYFPLPSTILLIVNSGIYRRALTAYTNIYFVGVVFSLTTTDSDELLIFLVSLFYLVNISRICIEVKRQFYCMLSERA